MGWLLHFQHYIDDLDRLPDLRFFKFYNKYIPHSLCEYLAGYSGTPLPPRGLPFPPPTNPAGYCVTRRDVVLFSQDSNAWWNAKTISKKIALFYIVNLHLFYTNATLRNISSVFFIVIRWISFWTSAHWASFGRLQLCNISNPKKARRLQ